ncbi:MAG TPA: sigma 54-interacting transcriptional regulator [Syntrophales bacterium]|nr:sigma 54-interacting transcriptional regulator [Syntrophales bacterium]
MDIEVILSQFNEEDKGIVFALACFPEFFSVDWFPHIKTSRLVSVILIFERNQWIVPSSENSGYYCWSEKFPKEEIISAIPRQDLAAYYRDSADILARNMTDDSAGALTVARQYVKAGVQEGDLGVILKAAHYEEANHRISSAIILYDSILDFVGKIISPADRDLPESSWLTFVNAIEHRTSLSLFDPSIKKTNNLLSVALERARFIGDLRSQASLYLLLGQNDWMYFRYEQAVYYFNLGWDIIRQIEDQELLKRGLKGQGLIYLIKCQFFKAIEAYENSLGELEPANENDFSHLVSLNIALGYTQVGMPQRGLGITEAIQNQCEKTANLPLLSYALVTAGLILLETRQFSNSGFFFERALELAGKENLPMVEVLAGMGLSSIECQEGNLEAAVEHYKIMWKIKKSSWHHILNFYSLLDTGYILHSKGVSPINLRPVFDYLSKLDKDRVNPLMYGMIQRLQLGLPEDKTPLTEKFNILHELEKTVEQMGATFELAKIRTELARNYVQIHDWQKAENYALKAHEFFNPIAPNCFPADLKRFAPPDTRNADGNLFDFVIELGDALSRQENLESLLTSIITSISKITGAERSALFTKDQNGPELKLAASRNLLHEDVQDEKFHVSMRDIHAVAQSHDYKILQYKIGEQEHPHFRQAIITPLNLGDRVIGVLYQDSRFFSLNLSPDIIKLLSAFASQIAVAIDRVQANEEIARLNKKLLEENHYYVEEIEESLAFGEIIGKSNLALSLHRLIKKVAHSNSTVLIFGETGVGKELVARAIHRESSRKNGPFIRVNCAALAESLIDSELFGHEKGSFTGAFKTKAGRFELANGGTIFLDEISELPLSTQSKLLRVLQEKEFQRVGGIKMLQSDFRLITASNKDLKQEVAGGKFRADLFYRLNVFPIYVPALRERREDIPLLATHFLKLFCSQNKKSYSGIPASEMGKLTAYSWPGNIRELSNVIERAVILGGAQIRFPEFESRKTRETFEGDDLKRKEVEKIRILDALKKTNGKVGGKDGAAARLGLNRTTLIHRMKKMGIKIEHNQNILET